MALPNLYNPYFTAEQIGQGINQGFQQGSDIVKPSVQQKLGFQESQREAEQPAAGLNPETQDLVRRRMRAHLMGAEAVMNGADPNETAMRSKMFAEGHLDDPSAGLPDQHPLAMSASKAGHRQAQAQPQALGQQPQQVAQAPQPQPQQPQANPSAPLTVGELQLAEKLGLRGETSGEKAQRQYYEQLLKNAGTSNVANIRGETAQNVEASRSTTKKSTAQTSKEARLGAAKIQGGTARDVAGTRKQSAIDVAMIRSQAAQAIQAAKGGANNDTRIVRLKSLYGIIQGVTRNIGGEGAPGIKERADQAASEIQDILADLKAHPVQSGGASSSSSATSKSPVRFMTQNGKLFMEDPETKQMVPVE